jgi:HK97 family phage portal protein
MSFLSRVFRKPDESRVLVSSNFAPLSVPSPAEDAVMVSGGSTIGGQAMALGAFYACVTLLADTIASLSVRAYRQVGDARVEVSPQPRLFQGSGPYPETSWFEWLWQMMQSLAITGNAFGFVTARDTESGYPTAVMPIHPGAVSAVVETPSGAGWPEVVYRVRGQRIPNEDIVHMKRFPVPGQALGMSPIQQSAQAVGLGLAAERFGLNYFRDSANPSSVLESDLPLDDESTRRLQQQWVTTHGGRRRPAILSGGVRWRPIAISPEESQFLATKSFQRSEIAMWFRIPPHMIGDTQKSTTWGSGLEQQSIGFVTYTLRPWLSCIEQALSQLLPRGQFALFNIDGLLRGDAKSRWEAYRIGRDTGVYSVNEIRALENLPPVDDGDGRLQPMNFSPLGYYPGEADEIVEPDDNDNEPAETDDGTDFGDLED